jgi:hypothetical protein
MPDPASDGMFLLRCKKGRAFTPFLKGASGPWGEAKPASLAASEGPYRKTRQQQQTTSNLVGTSQQELWF